MMLKIIKQWIDQAKLYFYEIKYREFSIILAIEFYILSNLNKREMSKRENYKWEYFSSTGLNSQKSL